MSKTIGFLLLCITSLFVMFRSFGLSKSRKQQASPYQIARFFSPFYLQLCAISILFCLSACGSPDEEPSDSNPRAKAVEISISGSNTLGKRLMPALVKGFMARNGYLLDKDSVISRPFSGEYLFFHHSQNKDFVTFKIESAGSLAGKKAMEEGNCDLAMASVPYPTKGKFRECKIGLDAIAVVSHEELEIPEALSLEMLANILCGDVTTWQEVSPSLPQDTIKLMLRDDASGTFKFLVNRLGVDSCSFAGNDRFSSNLNLVSNVARTPFAIGFPSSATKSIGIQTNLIKIQNEKSAVAYSPNDPVAIQNGAYPITRSLFLYYQISPTKLIIKDLIDFCLSIEGQNIVVQNGFIPSESNQVIEISNTEDEELIERAFSTSFPKPKRLSVDVSFTPFDPKCPDVPTQASLSQLSILLKYLEKDIREIDTVFVLGIPDPNLSNWRQNKTAERRNFWVKHFLMQNLPQSSSTTVFVDRIIKRTPSIPSERQIEVWVKKSNIYR